MANDCDDDNADVFGQDEQPYDGIDNDCNPDTLDDDLDGDGLSADDCDDNDSAVIPMHLTFPVMALIKTAMEPMPRLQRMISTTMDTTTASIVMTMMRASIQVQLDYAMASTTIVMGMSTPQTQTSS